MDTKFIADYKKLSHVLYLCNRLLKDIDRELKQVNIKPERHSVLLHDRSQALSIKADIISDMEQIADRIELKNVLNQL